MQLHERASKFHYAWQNTDPIFLQLFCYYYFYSYQRKGRSNFKSSVERFSFPFCSFSTRMTKNVESEHEINQTINLPFVIIFRRRKNNNFISNSCSFLLFFRLSAVNEADDQVDANESDSRVTEQINFVDKQLIIMAMTPCGGKTRSMILFV